jgi:3-methyladenine DNA glycosylase AlkD
MHREHAKLLHQIRAAGRAAARGQPGETDSYGGSGHLYYRVSVPTRRRLAKKWLAAQQALPAAEFLSVVESLFAGESHEEKTLGALLLGYCKAARSEAGPARIERWLDQLNGWAEVDTLCQNTFSADELLGDVRAWRALIERLARDANINKRRASIVLLTGPVRHSSDLRLRDLAFETVERLKRERPILITKALSWLLRSLVAQHADAVHAYLEENSESLPKIAVRETRTKLKTGRKTSRPVATDRSRARPERAASARAPRRRADRK